MKDKNVVLYGIFRAGKTSISETLKQNKTILIPKPTLAVNIDKWVINDQIFRIWDAPGQIKLLKMTWKYLKNHGINKDMILIFILDSSDKESFESAKQEFLAVINDPESQGAPLLFGFHKMDLQEAKENLEEAKALFDLDSIEGREKIIIETSVKDLDSILNLKERLFSLVE